LFAALASFEPWLTLVIQSGLIISTDGKRAVAFAQAISHHSSSYTCNGGAFLNFRVSPNLTSNLQAARLAFETEKFKLEEILEDLVVPQPGGI
jgi:hypothetical protein